ncbi:MAG TPA: hypothetical protein ENK26_10685, partial [Gammaproteobacteria bacterium]|nr:hypothetical protein [Gammaproteobacteria bacterium]
MDGNQSAPAIVSTSSVDPRNTPAAQATEPEGDTGFAALFEMIQRKASALLSSKTGGDQESLAGNGEPESGNALPIQFDFRRNPALNKARSTAVLSTTETRNTPLKDEMRVEEEITPLGQKLGDDQGRPLVLESVTEVPKINLPRVDAVAPEAESKVSEAKTDQASQAGEKPGRAVLEIPPVAKIGVPREESGIPIAEEDAVAPGSVETLSAAKAEIPATDRAEHHEGKDRIVFDNSQLDPKAGGLTGTTTSGVSPRAVVGSTTDGDKAETRQTVVIETAFSNGGQLAGINALDHELREGRYVDDMVSDSRGEAARVSTAHRPQIQMAQLETRSLPSSNPSGEDAPALVNAAFLQSSRQGSDASAMQTYAV